MLMSFIQPSMSYRVSKMDLRKIIFLFQIGYLVSYIYFFAIFRITDITSSVLVGQGEPALLECAVDANPLNNHTIRWERKNYDMAGRTKTSMGSPTSMASSMLSSSSMVTSKSVNSLFGGQENVGVVMLTVLNATAEDSGEFWCVASNGLGGQIARNASFLLVRRKLFFYCN